MMRQTALGFIAAFLLLSSSSLYGQSTRTWVSGDGDDANPCNRPAPCKTFAEAITKTAAGGIINATDAGAYGIVTITNGVTIDGSEAFAGVLFTAGQTGITINAPAANVILRNLDLNGGGTGVNGIRILSAANVSIENCRIANYTENGILDERTTAGALSVVDSVIRNSVKTLATGIGIRHYPATSTANVISVARTQIFAQTSSGMEISRNGRVLVSDSEIHGSLRGVVVSSSYVTLENCKLMGNPTGIRVTSGTTRLATTTITGGTDAVVNTSGTPIISFGNNRIDGNTGDNGAGMNNIGVK